MASKTPPQLQSLPSVADADLAVIWNGSGPLKQALMSSVRSYIAPSAQARNFLSDPDSEYVNFTQDGTGAVAQILHDKVAESFSLLDFIPVNLHAGIRNGTNATLLTTYIQAAITAANARFIGGGLGGGAVEIFVPAGRYLHGALVWAKGVCLRGEGRDQSLFLLSGSNLVGIGCTADSSTAVAADQIAYTSFSQIGFFSAETTPVGQVLFDAVGFTRTVFRECYWACGDGITAVRCSGAIPASTGGPASWHNDFYSCLWEKLVSAAGGTALLLGDTDPLKETITTWRFFGGFVKNAGGTGVNMQSGAGVSFYGVCFEGNNESVILGSGGVGVRTTLNVEFTSCYWEANTTNWRIYAGCTGTKIDGGFITGGAAVDATTLDPSGTNIDVQGQYRSRVGPDIADFWQVVMPVGADTYPTVVAADGTVQPGWSFEDGNGDIITFRNNSFSAGATGRWEISYNGVVQASGGSTSTEFLPSTLRIAGGDIVIKDAGLPIAGLGSQGCLWLNTSGGKGTTLYYKYASGSGNWGAVPITKYYGAALTPASVAANTSAEQTFTVTGLTTSDVVTINAPAPTAGTGIVGCRVSAADTLAITFANFTGGPLSPAAGTYQVVATVSG